MRKFISVFIILLVINLLTPILFYTANGLSAQTITSHKEPEVLEENTPVLQEEPIDSSDEFVSLYDLQTSSLIQVPLLDYLIGVAACEMPSYYEEEALKAQMISAYSYYLYAMENPSYLPTSYVPVNESLMHGYASKEKLMDYWQVSFNEHYPKYLRAAQEVIGEVVMYQGKVALTSYYAVSCGTTQSSVDEWGKELDYLTNVESPLDVVSDDYLQMANFTVQEMYDRLNANFAGFLELDTSTASEWFSDIQYTKGGYVSVVKIGESYVNGSDFRTAMNLASSSFMVFLEDGVFSIATKGYGHGVGMSQFGANEMSKERKTYKEILNHYYPGTIVVENS